MSMRITTSMVQRNVLTDLNSVSARLTRSQMKAASGKEISRPSDDPFNASRAMALRQDMSGTQQYQRNVQDAQGWQNAAEVSMGGITDSLQRARDLVVQGASDSSDQTARDSISAEIKQLIESLKQDANATYRGSYIFSGAKTGAPPYVAGADDTYKGDQAGLDPTVPGIVREIGPGVQMTINIVGDEILGSGQGVDTKLLATLRDATDHLAAGDSNGLRLDLKGIDANLDKLLEIRARNGARQNRLDGALDRLGQVEQATLSQLSGVEDADMAKTLIELSSQTAAYQSALRSGASIVQSSLMDFLR